MTYGIKAISFRTALAMTGYNLGPTKVIISLCEGLEHGQRGGSDQNVQAGPVQRKLFFH